MPLFAGDKLGPYEILSPIGAGGMGQVWKARDTRLDRIVAIKTSAERFSERFDREARAIAALNHPHTELPADFVHRLVQIDARAAPPAPARRRAPPGPWEETARGCGRVPPGRRRRRRCVPRRCDGHCTRRPATPGNCRRAAQRGPRGRRRPGSGRRTGPPARSRPQSPADVLPSGGRDTSSPLPSGRSGR